MQPNQNNSLQYSRNRNESGAALGGFLAIVVSILLILFVMEIGFRVLPIPFASPVVTINEPDQNLGWVKRHNESTNKSTSEFDITFQINDVGLRDDADLTFEKPAGEQRVLVVGDSFVLGYTVSRDDLFVDQLERGFIAEGRNIQVLNCGTEGYSTDQELVWLREEGSKFDPDVVVLCFYQNDVFWSGQNSYAGKMKPRFPTTGDAVVAEPATWEEPESTGWFARKTAIGGFLHRLTDSSGRDIMIDLGDGNFVPKEELVILKSPPKSLGYETCWNRVEACLRGFRNTCNEMGAKLLITAIPSREQVQEDSRAQYLERRKFDEKQVDFDIPTRRFLAAAAESGMTTLDPLPALQASAKDGKELYFRRDWHLNADGNQALAKAIYEKLAGDEFLGSKDSSKALAAISVAPKSAGLPRWLFIAAALWIILSILYAKSYKDENPLLAALKVAGLISTVILIIFSFDWLIAAVGPTYSKYIGLIAVVAIVGFLLYKSRHQLGIISEVYGSFVRQGHWYMIPLLVAMLTIGSLLIVASSSPFVAPFIYTLF